MLTGDRPGPDYAMLVRGERVRFWHRVQAAAGPHRMAMEER
jgi:hypothetical protein